MHIAHVDAEVGTRGNGSRGGSVNARAGRAEELKGYRWGRWE